MSKGYDKLADRTSFLEGDLRVIQIVSKDEKALLVHEMKSLESCVNDENKKLTNLTKSPESFTVHEVQTLQKAETNRF